MPPEHMTVKMLLDTVRQLAQTLDGVPITPGMTVYRPECVEGKPVFSVGFAGKLSVLQAYGPESWHASQTYSTRSLAEQAKGKP